MDQSVRLVPAGGEVGSIWRDVNGPKVEAVYPLSPMQQGMLFHALYAPDTDPYFTQAHWLLHGDLDVCAFHAAWQRVVDRHTVLRTSFCWRGREQQLQLVHRTVALPFEQQDWRRLSREQQDERLKAFLERDRSRGFDLEIPPLLRITVIRLNEQRWRAVWSSHHAIVDGRSLALVLREVLTTYEAERVGRQADLPAPTPYRAFIAWLQEQDSRAAETFWKAQMEDFSASSSFSQHMHSPDDDAGPSEQVETSLPTAAGRALHSLARSTGVTVNTVIIAAWTLLLNRHSGREDVVFGLTIGSGGQGAPLRRSLVGPLINTLPLRVQVDPHATVLSFLQLLQSSVRKVQRHANMPLSTVQRCSELPRGRALFDSIVVLDNSSIDRLAGRYGSLEIGHLAIEQRSSYPLNLVVRRGPGLTLRLIYHPHHFSHTAMVRLIAQLEHVLRGLAEGSNGDVAVIAPTDGGSSPHIPVQGSVEAIVASTERRLGQIPILPDRERQKLLVDWNATRTEYPRDQCFHRLFEAQAARMPDAMAIDSGTERLTYRELNQRANGLAHLLRLKGVGPEIVVGLALERSSDLVVSMLGVAKAGGAFLLLDPTNPPERIAFMLADAGASIVLTHRPLEGRFAGRGQREAGEMLCLDAPDLIACSDENPRIDVSARNLAYVIYTSGTTGRPKGVMIEHCSLMNLISWHRKAFSVSPDDRATQLANPAFDAAVWEIWPYLTAGASLHIPHDEVRAVPRRLHEWFLTHSITISFLPTPLAEALLSLPWPATTMLRTMLVGGDVLHKAPPPSLPFTVVNNYGPTECTVVATSGRVDAAARDLPPTIGRPIGNTEVYLLDGLLRPVPIGVVGEIYVGGAGVARGYLNRPELTRAKFLAHPFRAGERVYRTGDLARYREDGEIEFVGRGDRQTKVRGVRVEPGEIEVALRLHPEIREAVVLAEEDAPGDQRLIAYVVPRSSLCPDGTELRRFLRSRLPDYMIPRAYCPVDALPLTLNGKVDRSMVASSCGTQVDLQLDGATPRTPMEAILASIWRDTLKLDRVGIHDDFFDLGGDSLLAVALVEQIRVRLGRELAISDLFRASTIAALAQLLEGTAAPPSTGVLVPIQPRGTRPPFFCAAPILGTVFPYYDLAHHLADDQPLYGLQPLGLSDLPSIESLSRRYLDAVRSVQPHGPYRLGGWSFGGLVAFEMARQLQSAGQRVSLLAILDTPAPGSYRRMRSGDTLDFFLTTVMRGLWLYLRDYEYLVAHSWTRSSGQPMNRAIPRGSVRSRAFQPARRRLERAAIAAIVPPESHLLLYHPPTIRQMLRAFNRGLAATLRYRPVIFPGSITLLRTSERVARRESIDSLGWEELTGGVTVYVVPGNHMTLFRRPHVIELARTLQSILDQSHQDDAM